MASRIVVGNKEFWRTPGARDEKFVPLEASRDRNGNLFDPTPIPPSSPRSPFRAGVPYDDPETGIRFRVVGPGRLPAAEGWAPAKYWLTRYGISLGQLRDLCDRGFLDAAVEERSPTRRYRCRDEGPVKAHLRETRGRKRQIYSGTAAELARKWLNR